MKKLILAAFLMLAVAGQVYAGGTQIDEGQPRGRTDGKSCFVVCRFARQIAFPSVISADRIVVWDSTSADGVTINTSTTSHDALVAGVTMDIIQGSSRDNSATRDENYDNWGRVQVWGRHAGVLANGDAKTGGAASAAGDRVSTSTTAGSAGLLNFTSSDNIFVGGTGTDAGPSGARNFSNASRDSVGVILNRTSATSWDVFIKAM